MDSEAPILIDLEPGDPRLADALDVLVQLRPHLTPESFDEVYRAGYPQGLRFLSRWEGGRCVAVAGWRLLANTSAGRSLYVDDLVTDAAARSGGHGRALLAELTDRARAVGCSVLHLDSNVVRHDAHRFYLRERMAIVSHHFALRIKEG